jgi:hypothetical protein
MIYWIYTEAFPKLQFLGKAPRCVIFISHLEAVMFNPNNNNKANQKNPNKGIPGTNKPYDKGQGNRGRQLNPNKGGKKK